MSIPKIRAATPEGGSFWGILLVSIVRSAAIKEAKYEIPGETKSEALHTFCDFHELLQVVKQRQGGYFELTKGELSSLEDISQKGSVGVQANAKAIINFISDHLEYEGGYLLDEGGKSYSGIEVMPQISDLRVSVYPNPFSSSATIKTSIALSNGEVALYSIGGQLIKTKKFNGDYLILQTEELEAGIYFCRILEEGNVIGSAKMIKTE